MQINRVSYISYKIWSQLYNNNNNQLFSVTCQKSLLREGKSDSEITRYVLESMQKKPEGIISVIRAKALKPTLNLMNRIGG